jgi:hypothetical protein
MKGFEPKGRPLHQLGFEEAGVLRIERQKVGGLVIGERLRGVFLIRLAMRSTIRSISSSGIVL